jgi:hypothetical protein
MSPAWLNPREQDVNQSNRQKLEKLPQSNVVKSLRARAQGRLPNKLNKAKANCPRLLSC